MDGLQLSERWKRILTESAQHLQFVTDDHKVP